jgi:hypothetical protein
VRSLHRACGSNPSFGFTVSALTAHRGFSDNLLEADPHMKLFEPEPLPFDPLVWIQKPFAERARMSCEAWAMQGYGVPLGIYAFYAFKVGLYVWAWCFFCSFTPGFGSLANFASWGLQPIAFEKAVLWSMLFEALGMGCGSGPLTARYLPPIGGALYFLRPKTTKLPLFPNLPLVGGTQRSWFDVLLYAAFILCVLHALTAAAPARGDLIAIAILVPVLGVCDRTLFLCCRGEHYWTTCVCFVLADNFIPAAKDVQLALWFWAGFSKLNHHFPSVVCVMTSNSPLTRFAALRRCMYRDYPHDLRPSRIAQVAAHMGIVLELGVPLLMLLAPGGWSLRIAMVMMLMLHGYITSNVPMGVPIEWNIMVAYGAFALFWSHPDVSPFAISSPVLAGFLLLMLIIVPLLGNLFPSKISFLPSMRYYAGNWAYGVWLFRGESSRKLERLTKSAPNIYTQLEHFYDRRTALGLAGKVMAFRLMHLHGRALPPLIARAVPRFEDYEYLDGEYVAGLVLGWNFGDGHLHHEGLLRAVQAQCGFEPAELRCVFVESQPLGRATLAYRIVDAHSGLIEAGELSVAEMRSRQPWESPASVS